MNIDWVAIVKLTSHNTPEQGDNRWYTYINKQCRILSNSQCIWSSEISKKLKNLNQKFSRETNIKHILDINKNFLKIHNKNSEILSIEKEQLIFSHSHSLCIEESDREENSFLSNFLDFVAFDPINDGKIYRDSLITSYENTKVPEDAFSKGPAFRSKNGNNSIGFSQNDALSYYKLVTSCIRQHLKDPEKNELAFVISEFVAVFELKTLKLMSKFKRNDMNVKEYLIAKNDCVHGLQQFIRVIQETIVFYYNLNESGSKMPQCCLFTKDNLLNFVISVLLNDKIIYQAIFDLESLLETRVDENYKNTCEILKPFEPQDFMVSPVYCLNSKTLANFKKKKEGNQINRISSKNSEDIPKNTPKMSEDYLKGSQISVPGNNSTDKIEGNSQKLINEEKKTTPMTESKTENNSPDKATNFSYNKKASTKNKTTADGEPQKDFLNESIGKVHEKTFYSSSSYEVKNPRNNNFSLPQRQNSESFVSIKPNNDLSETQNNFLSFDGSLENCYITSNLNLENLSEYHSIAQLPENNGLKNNNNTSHEASSKNQPVPENNSNLMKKISFQFEDKDEKGSVKLDSSRIQRTDTPTTPYKISIELLRLIDNERKPLQKLQKVLDVANSIKKQIKEFYSEYGLAVKQRQIDSENVLAIFLYITVAANVRFLHIHLRIIENFTTENILNSKHGYYVMVLQLCLRFLETMNYDELKGRIEENRKIYIFERIKEWIRETRNNKMMLMGSKITTKRPKK